MHILSTWSHSLVARECGKIKIWHQVCVNLWTLVTSTDSIRRSHRMHLFIYRWFNSISSSSAHDAEYTRNIGFRFFIGIFMYGGLLSRNERLNHDFFWHCKFFIFLLDSCYVAHNAKNICNALNFFWLFIYTFCVLWIELVVIIFEALDRNDSSKCLFKCLHFRSYGNEKSIFALNIR